MIGLHGGTRSASRGLLASLTAAAVLLLGACGASPSGGDDPAAPSAAEPTPSASDTPSQDAPYVPGDPQNEVRPASGSEAADWPACDEVWTAEGDIPAAYEGCVRGDEAVVADRISCSFGGSMTTFDDRYYGVLGAVVNDAGSSLADSRPYAKAYRQCTA